MLYASMALLLLGLLSIILLGVYLIIIMLKDGEYLIAFLGTSLMCGFIGILGIIICMM